MRKPKGQTLIKLPIQQPDCCFDCPLCGKIPDNYERPKGTHENFVCCGTWDALTTKGIKVRASLRDSHHPLHRPCDLYWDKWLQLREQLIAVPDEAYLTMIRPFHDSKQLIIKFHKR